MVKFVCLRFFEWWLEARSYMYYPAPPGSLTQGKLVPRPSPPSCPWMVGDLLHNRGMAEQKTHTLTIMCSPTSFCQRGANINNLDPITSA